MTIDDLFVSETGKFAQNTRFWEIIDELNAYTISHPQWKRFASDLLFHLLPPPRLIPHYSPFASDHDGEDGALHSGSDLGAASSSSSSVENPDIFEKPMIRAISMCFLAFLGGSVGSQFSHSLHLGRITCNIAGDASPSLSLPTPSSPISPRVT